MPPAIRHARRFAFALLALALAPSACSDPTGPPEARIVIDASDEELHAARLMMDDVVQRLFPSLSAVAGAAELNAAVAALSDALDRADAEDLEASAQRAASALAAVRAQSTEAEAADLDAITLAIEESERLLGHPGGAKQLINPGKH